MIKGTAVFSTAAIIVSLAYAIAFRFAYPLTPMDANIYAFLAFCGVVTCGVVAGLWQLLQRFLPSRKP